MDEKAFSQAVSVLSGEHSLSILKYLSGGEWRIASDVSRALKIHTTTASKFLSTMHELGFLDRRVRKSRTRSAFEYRLSTNRIALELELGLGGGAQPLKEALDFYLEYVGNVLEKTRKLGWPAIERRFEARLETNRNGLKEHLFTRILDGGGARGMEDLKVLFGDIHREFLDIASESLGRATARRILEASAEAAARGREDLVQRYGLRAPLEG